MLRSKQRKADPRTAEKPGQVTAGRKAQMVLYGLGKGGVCVPFELSLGIAKYPAVTLSLAIETKQRRLKWIRTNSPHKRD